MYFTQWSNTRKCVHKFKIENITHFQWFIIDKEKTTTKLNKPIKGKNAKPTYILFFAYLNLCSLSNKTKNNWWEPQDSDNSTYHHHPSLHLSSLSQKKRLPSLVVLNSFSLSELVNQCCWWVFSFRWIVGCVSVTWSMK